MSSLADLYKGRALGTEEMEEGVGSPMLLISQAMSGVAATGEIPAGHFYDSQTKMDMGVQLDVIPLAFTKMWYEWKPNQQGLAGRWKPNSIPVTGDAFKGGLHHGENLVIDTYVYALLLLKNVEAGAYVFTSSRGNMKYLRQWNSQMKAMKLDGVPMPMYSQVWNLKIGKTQSATGRAYYAFVENNKCSAKFVDWVKEDVAKKWVLPLMDGGTPLLTTSEGAVSSEPQTLIAEEIY